MNAEKIIAGYLRIAAEDLKGARALDKIQNRNAIYLCSQAAEKVIRAVLTSEGQHAGVGHQLDQMVEMIPDENPVKPMLKTVDRLGRYATSYRYPTVVGRIQSQPTDTEFHRFADGVHAALQEVATRFEVDLSTDIGSAGNSDPIR